MYNRGPENPLWTLISTFTNCAISSKSFFTSTAERAVTVGAVSVLVTITQIQRTFIDICGEKGKIPTYSEPNTTLTTALFLVDSLYLDKFFRLH